MTSPTNKPGDLVTVTDGLPARVVHEWSDEKLHYVERYMDIFTHGMRQRWDLAYADFFSGPGVCVDRETRVESLGSPLRALNYEFDRWFFNDLDSEAVSALHERVGMEREGVTFRTLDCNAAVPTARDCLFPDERAESTLGLAFIDPTAYQITFESIRRLTRGVRLDLIITFMTNFPRRFIGLQGFTAGSNFDRFMGTRDWLQLGRRATTRQILDIYEEQLRKIGYTYVVDDARIINSKNSTMYHLIFASKNPRGEDFFRKISARTYKGQRRLL